MNAMTQKPEGQSKIDSAKKQIKEAIATLRYGESHDTHESSPIIKALLQLARASYYLRDQTPYSMKHLTDFVEAEAKRAFGEDD